ncbi:MAG: IS1634 family transposase, partial [Pseudomonadales bacterium]|nr:IS1634 family transposase [Pseudomonadales bacterium]
MLAYHLEWHLRRRLAPVLFQDDDRAAAAAERASPIQEASVSPKAQRKSDPNRTENGYPVHSLDTLMGDLATL